MRVVFSVRKILALISLFLLFIPPAEAADTENHGSSTKLRSLLRVIQDTGAEASQQIAKARAGGATVGVVADGKLVWSRSYGFADVAHNKPSRRDTIYRIGSITKQFVAVMLMQLVETGHVHLSDPVELYLPEVRGLADRPPNAAPITLVQLATHTAGLDREPDSDEYGLGTYSEWENETLKAIPHSHFIRDPGSEFWYSNIGYAILAVALSRAANESFPDYASAHIFKPLGMQGTFFEAGEAIRSRIAIGYEVNGEQIDSEESQRQWNGRGYKVPPGGLFSTVDDLARFLVFEMGMGPQTVLSNKSLDANLHRLLLLDDVDAANGLGFQWRKLGSTIVLGHTGGIDGYQAAAFYSNKTHRGVVVLINSRDERLNINKIVEVAMTEH